MGSNSTPTNAVDLCTKYEGFYKVGLGELAYPYICPAGVWTIGYGTTRLPNGIRVTKDTQPIDRATAEDYLAYDLGRATMQALAISPILAQSDERLGAVVSFIYNLGSGAYYRSTYRRKINEGDWDAAKIECRKWVWGGGRRLPGLVIRRNEEASYL